MISPKKVILSLLISVIMILPAGCNREYKDLDISMYQYRDTKELVKFVYSAALELKSKGENWEDYFKKNRAKYITDNHYLFITDTVGLCCFHAGMKQLEGKSLMDISDKDDKQITLLAADALKNKDNPHSWVHYSWWKPGTFYIVPKSSCYFTVQASDGTEFIVGGGLNFPREEKEFIRIIVDEAVRLIDEKGQSALSDISNPSLQFCYRDVRVFAFYANGEILISPVFDKKLSNIELLNSTDEVGHKPFIKALKKLETKTSCREIFMVKNRYKRKLSKKILYLRKTVLSGEYLYVGAITDLPEPP